MHTFKKLLIICFTSTLLITGCRNTNSEAATDETKEEALSDMQAAPIGADRFIRQITVGYNIGNSLDSCPDTGRNDGANPPSYYETAWGNPIITTEYIDAIVNAGFNTLKIPVTWYYNTYITDSGELVIQESWLNRVKEVIDYALSKDLYVILDSHHDEDLIWADIDDIDEVSDNLRSLWTQIATFFQNYDQHLIFEGFNEINTKGNSWKFSEDAAKATNILNQLFVDTVRSCGGQNQSRILICDTYLSSCDAQTLSAYVLPTDTPSGQLIIGLHCYANIYDQDMDATFRTLNAFSKAAGAPVLITEFGTTSDYTPIEYRSLHAGNYIAYANDYKIKCLWWDDGGKYSLIDRTTNTVSEADIIAALMNPTKFHVEKISTKSYNTSKLYTYGNIVKEQGTIADTGNGAITLTIDGNGIPVTAELGYHITLTVSGKADGLRICSVAFYDSQHTLLSYHPVNNTTSYDVAAPSQADYMCISIYNPWGYRSLEQYQTYLDSEEMQLEITEYHK